MDNYEIEQSIGWMGLGWQPLLRKLVDDLKKLGWDGDLKQVKHKFNSIRFYVGEATEEMEKLIRKAEFDSQFICRECGSNSSEENDWSAKCSKCK